jgi:hypothetical protein
MAVLVSRVVTCTPAGPDPTSRSQVQTKPSPYSTLWYAGTVYTGLTCNAGEINMTITVPSSAPRPDDTYYVVLAAWDSNGSYDRIGFSAIVGAWLLYYSWTTGPPSNLISHSAGQSGEAITLTQGATYTFWISFWTQNGTAQFGANQVTPKGGVTPFWSLNAPTGGNYLYVSYLYQDYLGYANYEVVTSTHISGGSPNFDFYFRNNSWTDLNHTNYPTNWKELSTTYSAPINVAVQINGSDVLVDNHYFFGPSPTIDQPPPLTLLFAEHEGVITWHPSSLMPAEYSISVNGATPTLYGWTGGPITCSIDGWSAGNYIVNCTVYDQAGRSVASAVSVTINETISHILILTFTATSVLITIATCAIFLKKRAR